MLLLLHQVSEAELEAIARMGEGATLEAELAAGAGGEATRQLLGEYQTPARCVQNACRTVTAIDQGSVIYVDGQLLISGMGCGCAGRLTIAQ
jgi:pre-mRNA-splicing factor CDC5/CEF1